MSDSTPELTVYYGPMFAGKSGALLGEVQRWRIGRHVALIFKPARDTRTDGECRSRDRGAEQALTVQTAAEILTLAVGDCRVVAIDEAQFFELDLVRVVDELLRQGKQVIVAGLNLDFRADPFPVMAALIARATRPMMLTAVCSLCSAHNATRTERVTGGIEVLQVGDSEYRPLCLQCYQRQVP